MTPVEWTTMLVTLIAALSSAIVSVIGALRTKDVQKSVETTNGKTIAHLIEDNHEAMTQKVLPVADTIENKVVPLIEKAEPIVEGLTNGKQ